MTVLTLPTSRRSRRVAARANAERALQLVQMLTDDEADHRAIAAAALRRFGTSDDAAGLVRAVVAATGAAATGEGQGRLVLLLTDLDGWTEADVAALLDVPVDDVAHMRAAARSTIGAERLNRRECRGWGLVGRRPGLTTDERVAADAHVAICRACRDRSIEQERARQRLHSRSAAATATVLADVVALAVPAGGATGAGLAGVAATKLATALVGVGALSVAIGSAGVAVSRHHPAPAPGVVRHAPGATGTDSPTDSPTGSSRVAPVPSGPASVGKGTPATQQPVSAPTSHPAGTTRLPLPATPTSLPTSLLPTSLLPTALPTELPVPLPTLVPSSLPSLPTVPALLPTP